MRYYIADLHFYHENLNTKMDCRGFSSAEEMNEAMIEAWNSRVGKKDEVVILGDFSVGNGAQTNEILRRLQGKKFLITGNHDHYVHAKDFDQSLVQWIKPYGKMHDNGRRVVLSHYPILCYDGQYRLNKKGQAYTYMLYGHVHDTMDEKLVSDYVSMVRSQQRIIYPETEARPIPCNMINCFCGYSDYRPLSLDEWIRLTEERRAGS